MGNGWKEATQLGRHLDLGGQYVGRVSMFHGEKFHPLATWVILGKSVAHVAQP